jgi:predicted phosphodiesterase
VAQSLTRIISDLHYGDKASLVKDLGQIAPLLHDAGRVLLNGDTIDTRTGPNPAHTARIREEIDVFIRQAPAELVLLTGNHDPDISSHHALELPGGLFVTHGDIVFDNIVPWGRDALIAGSLVNAQRGDVTRSADELNRLLVAHRRACAAIPQRHQAERHGLRYLASFLTDTIWPPSRVWHILNSWRTFPHLARQLLDEHRPQARFMVSGHTHWPGIWLQPDGRVIINTGSFCPPCGQVVVEFDAEHLVVRRVRRKSGDFHPGRVIAEFALTPASVSA